MRSSGVGPYSWFEEPASWQEAAHDVLIVEASLGSEFAIHRKFLSVRCVPNLEAQLFHFSVSSREIAAFWDDNY